MKPRQRGEAPREYSISESLSNRKLSLFHIRYFENRPLIVRVHAGRISPGILSCILSLPRLYSVIGFIHVLLTRVRGGLEIKEELKMQEV